MQNLWSIQEKRFEDDGYYTVAVTESYDVAHSIYKMLIKEHESEFQYKVQIVEYS